MRNKRRILALVLSAAACLAASAQSHRSTQGHEGAVTAICDGTDGTFFSAGQDGFVIRWDGQGMGEHYQMSDLSIRMISYNPKADEIAIYETDGASVNRVSVWSWGTFSRKYSKRFTDTVTALEFSAKGTYLMVGTAAVNGTYLFNARSGQRVRTVSEVPALSSMIRSSASEKTAIMYSTTGYLSYYDMSTHKQKARFSVEPRLEQPILFGTPSQPNRFFAGVRDNSIIISDATSGKVVAAYSVRSPYICTSLSETEEGFYFIANDGRDYSLRLVTNGMLEEQLSAPPSRVYSPQAPLTVKTFTALSSKETFTASAKVGGSVILGTNMGDICRMTDIPESEKHTLSPMTMRMYEKIHDIAGNDESVFLLTEHSVYRTTYGDLSPERIASNPLSQTDFILYKDSAILWSKGTRRPVQRLSLSSDALPVTLFTPSADLQSVRIFADSLVYMQGNSTVSLFSLADGKNTGIYTGTAVQDAVLVSPTELYVAKTSASQGDSALIAVNIRTMETVPLSLDGSAVFSLSGGYGGEDAVQPVYGVSITNQGEDAVTRIFSFNPETKATTYILTYPDEDTTAFTSLNAATSVLYTNIGKSVVYACNMRTKRNMQYKRSTAMPVKVAASADKIALLNSDGSITWYNQNTQAVLSDRFLTPDGRWE